MKLVYICGPYSANTIYGVKSNIRRAEAVAEYVLNDPEENLFPICPHLNTRFMDGLVSYEKFIEGDLKILSFCDQVWVLPDYKTSEGCLREISFAETLHKHIKYLDSAFVKYCVQHSNLCL